MRGRATAADTGAAGAQDAQQLEQLVTLDAVETSEDFLGTVATGGVEALEQVPAVLAERHEDRPSVSGVGMAGDEPGGFEGVDHRGDRSRDYLELSGQVGHPQGPAVVGGDESEYPGLAVGEPQWGELHARSPTQPTGSVAEQLRELERGVRAPGR
jgi:hypothetical protein